MNPTPSSVKLDHPLSPCPSTDFWFDDGSVVLQVESTLFRVHRSILSMHSDVFQGMFAVPQPMVTDGDLVDGCPVVQLSDRVVDWTHVLKALYSGSRKDHFQYEIWPFPVVAAYLRLGTKYEIEHLRTEASNVLSTAFPTAMTDFIRLLEDNQQPIASYGALCFDVITLARETGRPDILPAAYLSYCRSLQIDEVFDGIKREDGTLSALSAQDQESILRGWHTVVGELAGDRFHWARVELECDTQETCDLARKNVFHDLVAGPPQQTYIPVTICLWDDEWGKDLCESCRDNCEEIHNEVALSVWRRLPEMFGLDLPTWNDLLRG